MKRWYTVMILVVALLLSQLGQVHASALVANNEIQFTKDRVSSFLVKTGYLVSSNIMLSNAIPLQDCDTYTDSTQNIYFVFDGNQMIAYILVSKVGTNFYSTFTMARYPAVEQAYLSKKAVMLGYQSECFFLKANQNISILENSQNHTLDLSTVNFDVTLGDTIKQSYSITLKQPRAVYYFLSVDIVANRNLEGNLGSRWASTLASKINYQKGTNLTTEDVYYACWDTVDRNKYDKPEGINRWYDIGAGLYNMPLTTINGAVSESVAASSLASGKPLIMSISGSFFGHSVLLCGIDEDADYFEFALMDPDVSDYVYISLPNTIFNDPSQFVYTISNGSSYTNWNYTRY